MLAWLANRVHENALFQKLHARCDRCGLYYRKKLESCNHCSELSDSELTRTLEEKQGFRDVLGAGMIVCAILIVLIMAVLVI